MIKIIDSLYLTEKGCCIYNRGYQPVHIRQGNLDGACSVYTLMMNLLILKTITRKKLEDILNINKKETSPEVERLFHEFFDKHGLIRDGFEFYDLERLINKTYGTVVTATYNGMESEVAKDGFLNQIQQVIDSNLPIILGVDFKGGGGHAVLAIGYESDDEGLFNIFCLDPGYDYRPPSYWNMVISHYKNRGVYRYQYLTTNPNDCPLIKISDTLLVTKNK